MARVELGMSHDVFWNLGLYDWTLWVEKIKEDRKRARYEQEFEWIRLSHLEALIANVNRDLKKKATAFEPIDFYKPSWFKEEKKEEVKKISLKQVKSQLGSKFKK